MKDLNNKNSTSDPLDNIKYVIEKVIIPYITFDNDKILFWNNTSTLFEIKNYISELLYHEKLRYVRENLDKEEIEKKIKTFIENTGTCFDMTGIKNEIIKSDLFCANFIKNLGRQNIYENLQFSILEKYGKKIKNLPTSGNNVRFVYNSTITKIKPKKTQSSVKSIDFLEELNGLNINYYCKYTKGDKGGNQDNQSNDAILFLEESNRYTQNNNDDNRFVLLADGDYYQTNKFKRETKHLLNNKVKIHTINSILTEEWIM